MKLRSEHCSVHTHSSFCDGKNSLEAMAAAAYAAGVRYFGASSHSRTPIVSDEDFIMPVGPEDYRAAVLALREQYADRMEVLLGLEWDRLSDLDPLEYDYWIGSVHYQLYQDGRYYPSDKALEDPDYIGDPFTAVERYYQQVAEVAAMKPTILGHIDLISRLNEGNRLFDEAGQRYRRAALAAIHGADPKETLLEINTGGMVRGYRTRPYPAQFLLREWKTMGGRVIITSDAHQAETILSGYREAADAAKAAGFARASILTLNGPIECDLD